MTKSKLWSINHIYNLINLGGYILAVKNRIMFRFFLSGFIFFSIAIPFLLLPRKFHFKFLAPLFNKLYLLAPEIRVHNLSKDKIWLNKPVIYAGNHKCFADFCFISNFIKGPYTILIRNDLMKNIFFRFICWKMGFISIDRENILSQVKALNKAKKRIIKDKFSLIIFPEGWYNFEEILGRVRKGICKIAEETNVQIMPIAIYGITENFIFEKKLAWKDVYVKAGDLINYNKFNNSDDLIKHIQSEIKRLYYEVELEVSTGINAN